MANISIHGIRSLTVDVTESERNDGTRYKCITFESRDADGTRERVRFFTESLDFDLDGFSLE